VVETQLMGHACVLQFCSSVRLSHAAPPCCGAVVTLRERDWMPLPHACVHVLQPPKSEVAQSIGAGVGAAVGALVGWLVGAVVGAVVGAAVGAVVHSCVWQVRISWPCGQALPPNLGKPKARLRDW
jgi:uncharacterized membrane protein